MAFLTQDAQVNCNPTIAQTVSLPLSRSSAKGHRTHPAAPPPLMTIELADGIYAKTSIPVLNHSAVRSGFAGHPVNPRWSATKVVAWKTGREWRQGLSDGTLVVRSTDSLLIPAAELTPRVEQPKPQGLFCGLPWRRFLHS